MLDGDLLVDPRERLPQCEIGKHHTLVRLPHHKVAKHIGVGTGEARGALDPPLSREGSLHPP